jgi:phosphohistidine phosphatase SixA
MGMTIYLMRHGQAAPKTEVATDGERPLSPEGRTEAYAAANGFKRLGLPVDRIWTSSLLRAWQTAELVSTVLGVSMEVCTALGPEQDEEALFSALAGASQQRLLLVGHQPGLERAILTLSGNAAELPFDLSPVGVVWYELPEFPLTRRGRLRGLFPGSVLHQLGRA